MMQDTNATKALGWKRPLTGWLWFAGWGLLIATLAVLIRLILGAVTGKSDDALLWLLAIGIALASALVIGLAIQCLSSWRNFKRFLISLCCLAGLIALFYAEEDVRGKLAWDHFKTKWETKGEKFDFSAFIPPKVPEDQNFAMTPLVTGTYSRILDRNGHKVSPQNTNVVNRLDMPLEANGNGPTNGIGNWQKGIGSDLEVWQRYYRKLALSTNLFPVPAQPQTPAADVLLALSKYDSTIEELRRDAALPQSRFPLNYDAEEVFTILLPHLAPLKGSAVVLRLRALAEIQAGQSQKALDDVGLALSCTGKIRSEPFLISQLVRIAMVLITEQSIWQGLETHCWSDAQLSQLDQQLAALDFVADYERAIRAENTCQVSATEFLRRHRDELRNLGEDVDNGAMSVEDIPAHLMPSGWFYQNELRGSKFIFEQCLPIGNVAQQTIAPGLVKEADASLDAMPFGPYTMVCKLLLPSLPNCARKFAFGQAAVNLARTGCALERYRLAQGRYPDALDALAPQFIGKVPRDPVGGEALHYHAIDDRHFVLYSIGWNAKDDGGTVSLTKSGSVDLDNGDWVWRYAEK